MKVFVIHYKKLMKRKHCIIRQFNTYNIKNYEFIEIDRDELTNEHMNKFEGIPRSNKAGMAISLSHYYAYKEIAEKYDNALILEDDAIFSDNFMESLSKYLTELPEDYDMLFIGDGCKFHIQNHMLVPGKYIYERGVHKTSWGGGGATRCCDSYIVSKKCAKKMNECVSNLNNKINECAIDWWLNNNAKYNEFKVYWAEPTIVTQGSQNGLYETTTFEVA
jgi:glycosyl transferase family 25